MSIERALRLVAVLACLSLIPEFAYAQSNATIAGVVEGLLGRRAARRHGRSGEPGAHRESRGRPSPTARANTRSSTSCPGVYSVTFTLTGFNTVKREGIELTASFTATVNADMRVGSLEETITVSGQSPTVDVQNVTQQKVDDARRAQRDPGRHEVDRPDRRAHPRRDEHQPGRRRHGVLRCRPRHPRQPPATSRRRSTTG